MKIAGIIAEYNPFHTGHAYHIAQTRALSGADGIAVLMSGNFVQRGGPAIADKWTRARAAVCGGADLVLELPTYFAHGVAPLFANGAVKSFVKSGCIDTLSFGTETADFLEFAKKIAASEAAIEQKLKEILSPDAPYPVAYASAAEAVCGVPAALLSTPNNMLALEYIKALVRENSVIEPLCISRVGAMYHDEAAKEGYASASALRKKITEGDTVWINYMPEKVKDVYKEAQKQGRFPVTAQDFDTALLSFLRRMPASAFANICDMPDGFGNRIVQMAKQAKSIEELVELCAAKQYTASRVRRLVWSCFLGLPQLGYDAEPTYLRVLAFNEMGKAILKKMKETSTIPMVIKTADYAPDELFAIDTRATDLYFSSAPNADNRRGGLDYIFSPAVL